MKKNIITTIFLGLVAFVTYLFSMPASLYIGDSGELATAVATWSIAHPTGFPLYLILGKLFSYLLPMLEFAYRLNIFSALVSALTVATLFLIFQKLKISYWISVAVSLSLAVAYTFWSHATVIQVYSLSALFFALSIYLLLLWLDTRKVKHFYLLAILCGLGVATHLTFLLVLPFIFILVFIEEKKLITLRRVLLFFVLFVVVCGLLYSYIPLRASMSPELNWGDPSTAQSFIKYITQQDYSEKIGTRSFESWKLMLSEVGRLFLREFTFLGLIFILVGIWISKKQYAQWFLAGFSVIILNIILLAGYGNSEDIIILYRYFLPSYIIMAIFLAIGLSRIIPAKAGIFALILPVVIFGWHVKDLNRHNYELVKNTSQIILDSVPQDSILISSGDTMTGALMYSQKVLGQRDDLIILDDKLFTHTWYKQSKKKEFEKKTHEYADNLSFVLKNNLGRVYAVSNSIEFLKINFDFYPHGLVYKAVKKDNTNIFDIKSVNEKFWNPLFLPLPEGELEGEGGLKFLSDTRWDKEYFNKELAYLYTTSLNNYAAWMVNSGFVKEGTEYFEKALEIRENKVSLYNLWGINNALGKNKIANEYQKRLDKLENL